MNPPSERIIVSVGGSLIVPEGIDSDFVSRFRTLILHAVEGGSAFFIIAGGGKTARQYQDAARAVRGDLPRDDLDWLGIHATRLNAHLLRTVFREQAHPRIIKDPSEPVHVEEPILLGAGWRPGQSTDFCAVTAAKVHGAKKLVNLSNIDYVYTADPRTNPDAKPIERTSWSAFRALIPSEWDPGLSAPFDPVAAKEAESLGLEVAIMNGANLGEFEKYLAGEPFTGTVIS
ncbi:MAG TPA: UMP kinase [Candidatus Paceibacterota bacterium]